MVEKLLYALILIGLGWISYLLGKKDGPYTKGDHRFFRFEAYLVSVASVLMGIYLLITITIEFLEYLS